MLQALKQRLQVRLIAGQAALQPVHDFHVRLIQQTFQYADLMNWKCSAVRVPKATQPEVEFEQTATTTPANLIRHVVSPARI